MAVDIPPTHGADAFGGATRKTSLRTGSSWGAAPCEANAQLDKESAQDPGRRSPRLYWVSEIQDVYRIRCRRSANAFLPVKRRAFRVATRR